MKTQYLSTASVLASLAVAQSNTAVDILSCDDLSCINRDVGVCRADVPRAIGVGIAPDVLAASDSSLSLTLVDGEPLALLAPGPFNYTTRTLYVGAPADLDVGTAPPACALMMQYQGQTFPQGNDPQSSNAVSSNSTSCDGVFSNTCRETFANLARDFRYNANSDGNDNTTGITLTRCEALAEYITARLRPQLATCGYFNDFLNITGGAILGPDAVTSTVQLQSEGCQPTSPQEYQLRQVSSMYQILDREADTDTERRYLGAGRSGVTPVMNVFYSGDDESTADIQFACMKAFAPEGEELPFEINYPTGGAATNSVGAGVVGVAAVLLALARVAL